MDTVPSITPQASVAPATVNKMAVCPQCHQPVLPEYYYCPNCGKKLDDQPLSTSIWAQIWLYTFTLIFMPLTCYLIYTHWKGLQYFRSEDPKARRMGLISIILLVISFGFLVWSTWASIVWVQGYVSAQESSISSMGLPPGL